MQEHAQAEKQRIIRVCTRQAGHAGAPDRQPGARALQEAGGHREQLGGTGYSDHYPSEGAIIGADVATKAANVDVVFVDRFNGSLVINGDVASVESALRDVLGVLSDVLGFTLATSITRT